MLLLRLEVEVMNCFLLTSSGTKMFDVKVTS